MDNSRWLKFIVIGLVLAAVAVGYFLLTGRLGSKSIIKTQASPDPSVLGQDVQTSSAPTLLVTGSPMPSPISASAYDRIVSRTQNNVQTLPATGFPAGLTVVFSVSALIAGWGLRKFPH